MMTTETSDHEPVLTALITVRDDGTPSAHYPDDGYRCSECGAIGTLADRGTDCDCDDSSAVPCKLNGALDYTVEIALARDGVQYQLIESSITLYADKVNGGMSDCGSPIDVWCAGPIVSWLRTLDRDSYRAAVKSLGAGPGTEEIEFALAEDNQ